MNGSLVGPDVDESGHTTERRSARRAWVEIITLGKRRQSWTLAISDDVRACNTKRKMERRLQRWMEETHRGFQEPDGQQMLRNIRLLREMFEPEDLDALRARRDRAA